MVFSRWFSWFVARWRRWLLGLGILLLVLAMGLGAGKGWIVTEVQARVQERLGARGLRAEWREVSWSLWRGGARFGDFSLYEIGEGKGPMMQTDSLVVGIPPWEWVMPRARREISWSVRHVRVVLTDADGSVALEDVSARVASRRGKILVRSAEARVDGLAVDLEGVILTRKVPQQPPKAFVMKLQALRGTLAALDFGKEAGRFKVTGSFELDMRSGAPFGWSAKLRGAGKDLVWKGVPLEKAGAQAELSSVDSVIKAGVATAHGKVKAVIERKGGWKETPFAFIGRVEDDADGKDEFRGEYRDRMLTVDALAGNADLWSIAGDVPALAKGRSEALVFRRFPKIEAKGIRWNKEDGWSMENAAIGKSGEAVVKWKGREIDLKNLVGDAGYAGKRWQLKEVGADLLGGSVVVSGGYGDGRLSKGKVKAAGLKISAIKRAMGKKKAAGPDGVLTMDYAGAAHFKDLDFDGGGSVRLDNAPVIEVPLLDEVHDLFATIVPGVERSGEGKFEADFSADGHVVHVKRFSATGGTLVVDAEGDVDLKKETVTGTARGKLTGLPGVVTSPLSRLLEMEVGGSLEKIRVQRLRPGKVISNAASGVIDVIKSAGEKLDEKGKE